MKNMLWKVAIGVLALLLPAMAHAQNVETIPGPYLSGSAPTGFSLQNYRFSCDNVVPTSGRCWPLSQLYDGTNLGVVNPNGQASANNSAPVVLPSTQVPADPCALQIKATAAITFTAGIFQVVAPAASPPKQIYVCTIVLNPDINDTISLFEGTGATCAGGSPFALLGSVGATLSLGMAVGALNGYVHGNGGAAVYTTKFSGDGFCIGHTGSNKVAGSMEYIQQ